MTREEIVELFAKRDAAINEQDLEALTTLFAVDAVAESPLGGAEFTILVPIVVAIEAADAR